MADKKTSLDGFLAARIKGRGDPCSICPLPERDEIDAYLRVASPPNRAGMVDWLIKECGHPVEKVTVHRIKRHETQCLGA